MSTLKKIAGFVLVALLLAPSLCPAASQKDTQVMDVMKQSSEAYEAKDYGKVKKLLTPLAKQNDPNATFVLGLMSARGEGSPKDLKAAQEWWKRSSDAGNPLAQFNLGYLYFKGAVGAPDYSKARQYWTLAARQKNPDALYGLGVLQFYGEGGPKDLKSGVGNFQAAANSGHVLAQYELGQAYLNGQGVRQDRKKAREWFTKAATKGMPEAKSALEAMQNDAAEKAPKKTPAKKPKP